jgi:hypothetical protein
MVWWMQAAVQVAALPVSLSMVQPLPSLHDAAVGQLPSQVSPVSTTPFPHVTEQNGSLLLLQPAGQQLSPVLHWVIAWWVQAALQLAALPVSASMVQPLPSSHVAAVGQLPSQVSPGSTTMFPQLAEQNGSLFRLQPAGQQLSPPVHWVIAWCVQAALQLAALPVSMSMLQPLPSSHIAAVGQLPSQVSPGSTTRLPQLGEQVSSLLRLHPGGQQPSPFVHWVMVWRPHATLQVPALPVMVSMVQELPSSHDVGQLPSQVSPGSTAPLPHVGEQSLSVLRLHPVGQQPSAFRHWVMDWCEQARLQLAALPVEVSMVHEFPSLHDAGQLPSQVSPISTAMLPQVGEQSLSLFRLQPMGQQPSAFRHWVTACRVQATLQLAALPVRPSMVQALPSLQDVGQLPSQVSPGSTAMLPQLTEQSPSLFRLHPVGQQPSPSRHWVMAW